jgi:hypothetical protein
VTSSPSAHSTAPRRSRSAPPGVDVYLFPAVVGGGLGDIEEVLAAGRFLERAGFPLVLYRRAGRTMPRSVEGPWEWPPHRRVDRVRPRHASALTVAPAWGISAAPGRPGAFGRPGPWSVEARDLEQAYGPDRVLHVSLEEFARTLTAREETRERFREGGVPAREIPSRVRVAERNGEIALFRREFERFRAFDRPDVLHIFATFRPSRAFAREYPAAVQTGPLWPGRFDRAPAHRSRRRSWVWYASPASAERIASAVAVGLASLRPFPSLLVRSPRPWSARPAYPGLTLRIGSLDPRQWRHRFASADVRIVTGSRTLLEALERGGPFLYFNGILGTGARVRRHRPEKIDALLDLGRRRGVPLALRRDLARFARGEDIPGVVHRIARTSRGWDRFRTRPDTEEFEVPYRDAGALVVCVARALARAGSSALAIVRSARDGSIS